MRIKEMTATFGCLDRAVLTPGPGLTLVEAPNESGKSTWCAFLRAMFYGFPARDRDSRGYIAEKNRYQPWSGAPMEGTVLLEWQGREITLHRGPRGNVPWGTFSAVYTASAEPVPGLTAENCGDKLLGVSREVFERTAFVGQGGVLLSPSGDLEKRVSALVTTGEEEVSFSQVERRLKDRLNRRRVNAKVGLIPELEGELAAVQSSLDRQRELMAQTHRAVREREELEGEKEKLEGELRSHAAAQTAQQTRRRAQAKDDFERAQAAFDAARAVANSLPSEEVLRHAQGDLHYLNTVDARRKEVERALPSAREELAQATVAATTDPHFGGEEVSLANERTRRDYNEALRLERRLSPLFSLLGALGGGLLGAALCRVLSQPEAQLLLWAVIGAGMGLFAVLIPILLLNRGRRRGYALLMDRYQVRTPQGILDLASRYGDKVTAARELQRQVRAMEEERDRLIAQRGEMTAALLELVHPFAPEVTDLFGISAALSRALTQGQRLRDAQTRLDAAEGLLAALPDPGGEGEALSALPVTAPQGDAAQLAARLARVNGDLARAADAAARLEGELGSLGDPAELAARRDALAEALEARREEYAALVAALEGLKAADSLLRERFSPALNQAAGQYLAALTGGAYTSAALTRQFQAVAQREGDGAPRSDLTLSAGAAQQLYLAARLALCQLALPGEEPCPIFLDDALDAFDDHRADLALRVLAEVAKTRQVFLFTCQSREGKLLEGTPATRIAL